MNPLERLIQKMIDKPGLYLGWLSLDRLSSFVDGYCFCADENGASYDKELRAFQNLVADRYEIRSTQHWSRIIRFFSASDESAFKTFDRLWHQFLLIYHSAG